MVGIINHVTRSKPDSERQIQVFECGQSMHSPGKVGSGSAELMVPTFPAAKEDNGY
jgi:hypothetical protein